MSDLQYYPLDLMQYGCFGDWIKQCMAKEKITTIAELSRRCGLPYSTVERAVNFAGNTSLLNALAIARAVNRVMAIEDSRGAVLEQGLKHPMGFSIWLRSQMFKHDLSAEALAKQSGLSASAIRKNLSVGRVTFNAADVLVHTLHGRLVIREAEAS